MSVEKEFASLYELIDELQAVVRHADESHSRLIKVLACHLDTGCGKGCLDIFPHPKVLSAAKTSLDAFIQEVTVHAIVGDATDEPLMTAYYLAAYKLISRVHAQFDNLHAVYVVYTGRKRPYKCKALALIGGEDAATTKGEKRRQRRRQRRQQQQQRPQVTHL